MDWLYETNNDNTARYVLGPNDDNHLLCFGVNPSTASPESLDNTIKSVDRIAKRHLFGSFIMLNIYPQRATDPNDLHSHCDTYLHEQNLLHIDKYLSIGENRNVLAAWGNLINKRPYLKSCLRDIYVISERYNCEWYHIGPLLKNGHPHHPLYLSNEERLQPFDMDGYLSNQ